MYKLKSNKGEITTIRMNGFQYTIVGGSQYDQTFLEKLYNSGHKKLVSKSKNGKAKETTSDEDIQNA